MKGVRFSAVEVSAIRTWADGELGHTQTVDVPEKVARSILAKLKAAEEAPAGVNPGPIEQALIRASREKVVPLAGGWPRASKMCTSVGATVDDAAVIGRWMASQGWMRGPQTLLDVLNKWPQWLAKAKATQPPPVALPGFGAGVETHGEEAQPGTARPSAGGGERRTPPGFGRKGQDPHPDGAPEH